MIQILQNPSRDTWEALCRRPASDNPVVLERVKSILQRVKEQGDQALRALSREIDSRPLETIEVSQAEIRQAEERVSPAVKAAMRSFNSFLARPLRKTVYFPPVRGSIRGQNNLKQARHNP